MICLGRNEPFGLIPLEAAACGVPVVALKEGGYPETIIDGKSGYLVSSNPKHVAEKINYLLSNASKRVNMGVFAQKNAAKKWDWKARIKEIEKVLAEFKEDING